MTALKSIGFLCILNFLLAHTNGQVNNVCNDWLSYYNILFSSNCRYEADVFSNTPEILARHVGENNYENYTVTTDDGYILTLFRIKKENRKGVVILQHPITADGVVWVAQSNNSVAFLLWELGYEVWLPNHRGTFYSEEHVSLSSSNLNYWNFSFHEIAIYDYPKFIEKVSQVSGSNEIAFIGHSMAGTSGIILSALDPDFVQQHIKIMILMSPATILKNVKSPLKSFCPQVDLLQATNKLAGIGAIFTPDSAEVLLGKSEVLSPIKTPLVTLLNVYSGWTPGQCAPDLFNLGLSMMPRGSAWQVIYHYAQIVNAGGRFQYYDYGETENLNRYNSTIPPEYPLQNISVPVFLVASSDDSMVTVADTELLYAALPESTKIYGNLTIKGLNHVDFHFGKDRLTLVYNPIFNLLNTIYGN